VIGVNALDYSGYPDCRPEFLRAFGGSPRSRPGGVEGRSLTILAPLLELSKADNQSPRSRPRRGLRSDAHCYDPGPDGSRAAAATVALTPRGFRRAGTVEGTWTRDRD